MLPPSQLPKLPVQKACLVLIDVSFEMPIFHSWHREAKLVHSASAEP